MQTKVIKFQPTCFIFIVEASNTVYRRKPIGDCPLNRVDVLFNKLVSKTRWVVERTFGSIKRWFGSGKVRYKGLTRVYA
ncbi:MAG: transposase [Flavobacteriales bacterium Tduv]